MDERISESQRNHESVAGAYKSEELIEAYTDYITMISPSFPCT
ncbi:MAG: hypothetical protein WCY97_08015 [Methanothrix sp.]|nr:hypothetical protein [Methanothrix sp.]MDD5768721.1 hypothetical protein [Methanothrix sp.]MDI9397936.1 hypothetical protein [Euryarchaeota archaeon]